MLECCRRLKALLGDYLDGELDEQLCQEMESHLGDCQPCRAVVDTTVRWSCPPTSSSGSSSGCARLKGSGLSGIAPGGGSAGSTDHDHRAGRRRALSCWCVQVCSLSRTSAPGESVGH